MKTESATPNLKLEELLKNAGMVDQTKVIESLPKDKLISGLIFTLLSIPSILWAGFVLSHLWLWFFVVLGLPVIGTVNFAGITLVYAYLVTSIPKFGTKTTVREDWNKWIYAVIYSLVTLFTGWIIHLLM